MKQPLSVISCLAYLAAGAVFVMQSSAFQYYLGIIVVGLAVASAGFHWTLTDGWQKADEAGMLATFAGLIYYQHGSDIGSLIMAIVLGIVLAATHRKWGNDTIGLLGIMAVTLKFQSGGELAAVGAFVLFLVGLWLNWSGRDEDKKRITSDAKHALWHVLTAGGILLLGI